MSTKIVHIYFHVIDKKSKELLMVNVFFKQNRFKGHYYEVWPSRWKNCEVIYPFILCLRCVCVTFNGGRSLQFGSAPSRMACDCCVHSWCSASLKKMFLSAHIYSSLSLNGPSSPFLYQLSVFMLTPHSCQPASEQCHLIPFHIVHLII